MTADSKINKVTHHRGRLSSNADAVLAQLNAGSTYAAIAKKFGVAIPSVYHFAKRRGITRNPKYVDISQASAAMLHEIARLSKLIYAAQSAQVKIDALKTALLVIAKEEEV